MLAGGLHRWFSAPAMNMACVPDATKTSFGQGSREFPTSKADQLTGVFQRVRSKVATGWLLELSTKPKKHKTETAEGTFARAFPHNDHGTECPRIVPELGLTPFPNMIKRETNSETHDPAGK